MSRKTGSQRPVLGAHGGREVTGFKVHRKGRPGELPLTDGSGVRQAPAPLLTSSATSRANRFSALSLSSRHAKWAPRVALPPGAASPGDEIAHRRHETQSAARGGSWHHAPALDWLRAQPWGQSSKQNTPTAKNAVPTEPPCCGETPPTFDHHKTLVGQRGGGCWPLFPSQGRGPAQEHTGRVEATLPGSPDGACASFQ